MNYKPFSLEGLIYTPLSKTGKLLDNLSPITSWPSFNGAGGLVEPSHQHQEQQQLGVSGFMASEYDDQVALDLDIIYTAECPSSVLDTTTAAASFSTFENIRANSFAEFDSSNIHHTHILNHNYISSISTDIQETADFLGPLGTSDVPNKSSNDTKHSDDNDMSLLTTTYFTKSAALNLNSLTPFSTHPHLAVSRSSSITSAVSYIDPAVLTQNNINNNCNNNSNNNCVNSVNGGSGSALSTPPTRRHSTLSSGSFESEDENYMTLHTMFENNLRMSSPAFGSYSTERFESTPSLSTFTTTTAAPETTLAPEFAFLTPSVPTQDIHLTDGSVLRFDGASFRPVPTATTSATMTVMNSAQISMGMTTMPMYRPSVMSDPTLSLPSWVLTDSHQQLSNFDSSANNTTASFYNSMSLTAPLARYQKCPSINGSFKTYDKSPYHRHLSNKSAATTTDSTSFASALLAPYSTARRGSTDSSYSTATSSSSRSRLVMGSHSRHSSTASFRDFNEGNVKKENSSLSLSLLSSSLPSASSSSAVSSSTTTTKYRKDKNGQFQCPFAGCDYRYNLKREFSRHRNVHVFAGKDKYRCMHCGSGLCRLDSVKRHMEAKGKADCLKKGLYEEFHESGQCSLIRKCKESWYEAAAAARAAAASAAVKKK
ncbi:hypothetical protein EC991_006999 [Linnemannia zychae]|nr:hypothetical protein EC991_006999 [Linnemannia zychae]